MNDMSKFAALQRGGGFEQRFFEDRYHHCKGRFEERYNTPLTYKEWQDLNYQVFMDRDATYLDKGEQSNSSLYILNLNGQRVLCAYSEIAYCVVTLFPRSDSRLYHAQNNSYTTKACTDEDFRYRDNRRMLAERFDELVDSGFGQWVLPKDKRTQEPVEVEPKAENPFAKALADFKPAVRPILTLASQTTAPQVEPQEPSNLCPAVLEAFGQLEARFRAQTAALDAAEQDAANQIAQLEARITRLRDGDEARLMSREFVSMSSGMAVQAFEKYRDGLMDEASALAMGRLMLAQAPQCEMPDALSKQAAGKLIAGNDDTAMVKGPARSRTDKQAPFGPDNPEPIVKNGQYHYKLDGKDLCLMDWARQTGINYATLSQRLRLGWTFRDAITVPTRQRKSR